MKKLIITADDYGMSIGVNEAIDQGIEAGLITSTNVMTNMEYYNDAVKLLGKENLSIGLHWTLSCGKPVSDVSKIPTLVNEKGLFYSYAEFRRRYRKKLISKLDIEVELKAQYERFCDVLGQPDYWNTHQNVHVDFGIYKVFVKIATKLGINKMRSHQRIYVPAKGKSDKSLKWRILEPIKSTLLNNWQKRANRLGISSPNGLIVCLNDKDVNDLKYLFSNIKWNRSTVGEYVIHPSTKNDSNYFGRIVEQRMKEYEQFTDNNLKEVFKKNKIELVSYKVLKK